jgi:hypothetical protein
MNSVTVGYWLKGDSCIRIDEEPHGSAILRHPARFGIEPDAATFAFDNDGESSDLVGYALHNDWIKIRRHILPNSEHWVIVFADFSRSRLGVSDFVKNTVSEGFGSVEFLSLTLDGVEDGFHREIELRPNDLSIPFAEDGLGKDSPR